MKQVAKENMKHTLGSLQALPIVPQCLKNIWDSDIHGSNITVRVEKGESYEGPGLGLGGFQ
jgi:hypothetical protein